MNPYAIITAALCSFVIGFIWYNPKVFGTTWMNEAEITEEKIKSANMVKVFGVSLLFSILLAAILNVLTIHQLSVDSLIGGNTPENIKNAKESYHLFKKDYANVYRTFSHGALHGFISGVFIALPILGTNALFENKSWKYIFINSGYWIFCMTIMGGIICAWK